MTKDRVARKMADAFLNVQQRFASFMNNNTAGCSIGMLKVSFFILCFVFISLSIWSIAGAFNKKTGSYAMKVTHMREAPLIKKSHKPIQTLGPIEFLRIQRFRKYMDSLRVCDSVHYDSILLFRPGLMDSVTLVETIYLKQK